MQKKTVATTLTAVLVLFFITIIGSCFSAYIVHKNKIELKEIKVYTGSGIVVADKKDKQISSLKICSSEMGVRPATGEQNRDTNIPSTVNNSIGTEGAYGVFFLTTESAYEIRLKSVSVTNGLENNEDNIYVGVMDDDSEAINFEKMGSVLYKGDKATKKEIVIVSWLDGDVSKSIVGADIFIEIEIVLV